MSDYSSADLKHALAKLPLEAGDVVFCHANLGFFGRPKTGDIAEMVCDAIMRRTCGGTLCVPAFTYSFSKGEVFDPLAPSKMGALSEWVKQLPEVKQSLDPCYSVAGIGREAADLLFHVAENTFDTNASFFARFFKVGGKVLNINFDAGSTFVHWVERQLEVPYRFDKTFSGMIVGKGRAKSTIFVHYRNDMLAARFDAFDRLARERGAFRTERVGRGEIGVISAADTCKLIAEALPKYPWFLTEAGAHGLTPNIKEFVSLR
jgi:aminoglycoside 3-N-acetyltransferase